MKVIRWSQEKNQKLQEERGITFETVLASIQKGNLLDDVEHPDQAKYLNQRMLIIRINNYAFLVPYVITFSELFLKTIIPSRKATKKYLGGTETDDA